MPKPLPAAAQPTRSTPPACTPGAGARGVGADRAAPPSAQNPRVEDACSAAAGASTPVAGATDGPRPHRRALWQLPAAAWPLLLGLSWTPAALRREIERVLSRQRRQPVALCGSDADVLASVQHDLAQRNPLSEHLQRLLAARHRLACQRVAAQRGADALKAAWLQRPAHEAAAATLWALLTHPQTPTLPGLDAWLMDELQQWVHAQAHRAAADDAARAAAAARATALQAERDALRQRLLRQQLQAQQVQAALQSELARLRGRLQPVAAPASQPPDTQPGEPVGTAERTPDVRTPDRRTPDGRLRPQAGAPLRTATGHRATAPVGAPSAPAAPPSPPANPGTPGTPSTPGTPGLQGRQILCVGGIQRAVARYRQRIERLGGRFEHHDGGIEDNPHALQGGLARADLVICQAGCINHAAYHRIKQHCQRTGKPCVYLERASLARFEQALLSLPAPPVGAVDSAGHA